jgi:hypothetical protein
MLALCAQQNMVSALWAPREGPQNFILGTGEVYVLNDGGEVDLDLGNYERYLNVTLSRDNNITTGKIYREVIEKEVGRSNFEVSAEE